MLARNADLNNNGIYPYPLSKLFSLRNDVCETSGEIPYWWRVPTQIWVVTRRQYGISVLVSQTSFREETRDAVTTKKPKKIPYLTAFLLRIW